jgi:hypothetical protein
MNTENDTLINDPLIPVRASEWAKLNQIAKLLIRWLPPETAPLNGTLILGDFGWPWANFAVWDEYDEHWCISNLQACPMANGRINSYIETDTEKLASLKRWMPLPKLPK